MKEPMVRLTAAGVRAGRLVNVWLIAAVLMGSAALRAEQAAPEIGPETGPEMGPEMGPEIADYALYFEVKGLYEEGMASDDCSRVDAISTVLRKLASSKELIPPELAAELRTGRSEVGVYVRHIRRLLNKRASELCPIVPAPCKPAPESAEKEAVEQLYAIAMDSQYCSIVVGSAQQMIGDSSREVAPHTLQLLLSLQRQRPECFDVSP